MKNHPMTMLDCRDLYSTDPTRERDAIPVAIKFGRIGPAGDCIAVFANGSEVLACGLDRLGACLGIDFCLAVDTPNGFAPGSGHSTDYRVTFPEIRQLRARGATVYVTTDPASAGHPDRARLAREGRTHIPQADHAARYLADSRECTVRQIARDALGIRTLAVRGSDRLDFHELSVGQIEAALRAAYDAGRAVESRRTPDGSIVAAEYPR